MTGAPDDATVAALLVPVAGGAGENLRPTGEYERIAEARRDENPGLPRGVWVRDIKQADWSLVERMCSEALAQRSKDLRIACWLCEAWVHNHGFAGLAAGLALLHGLCRDFWPGLYPPLDGDDASARLAAFDWLNDRLPVALRRVPFLVDSAQPGPGLTWADCLAAARLEAVRRQDARAAQKAEEAGAVTSKMVDDRSGRTDPALLKAAIADLGRAMTALAALDQALDRLCGRDAPGLGKIRGVAIEIGDFAVGALAARKAVAAPAAADPAPATPPAPPRQAPPATMSRAEAYRQLAAIADILRASEPHSPVPDVLDQLVSWRDLSMIELDSALRRNGSNVAILLESLGFLASQGGESPNS